MALFYGLVLLIMVVAVAVAVVVATATRGTEATWLLVARLGLVCVATMRDIWVFTFLFHFFLLYWVLLLGIFKWRVFFLVISCLLFCILFWVCCFYTNYGLVQKFLRVFLILVEGFLIVFKSKQIIFF